jgi:molecular chaperone GrpE
VTSKEPTLAEKKKTTRKPRKHSEKPPKDAETVASEGQDALVDLTGDEDSESNAKPVEEKPVTETDGESTVYVIDDEEDEADRRAPSAKDVLNRLLEKNEIILKLNKENSEKDKQLKDLNDKWIRSVAEFENYRKRSRKEWELLKQQAKTEVILEILNTIDDFERAFSVVEDGDDDFVQGIKLIYNNLLSVLEKFGVQEIESINRSFDPNCHMAVGQLETEDVETGHVAEVIQKGYRLDDSVIRPARVIVAK